MKKQTRHHHSLGAYLDGEVSGLERLRVANHLETCDECATDAADWREVGDWLRHAAATEPLPVGLEGLAGGVVSRIRAESAQSWSATFSRAFDDWHWFAAAAGALCAAFISTLTVSLLLHFGPTPRRDDSLAALMANLQAPAGTLFILGTQGVKNEENPVLMQFDNGSRAGDGSESVMPVMIVTGPDALVTELSSALSAPGPLNSQSMHPKDRLRAESLLDQINRWHFNDSARAAGPVTVQRMLLFVGTNVSAKGI